MSRSYCLALLRRDDATALRRFVLSALLIVLALAVLEVL